MDEKTKPIGADARNKELDEELTGILLAISIVSKRLARKLSVHSQQVEPEEKGGKSNEQNG